MRGSSNQKNPPTSGQLMLDPSPMALPPILRPLKRSASTASLPTPPRTHRKHARRQSRGSYDSDSDEDVVLTSDDEMPGERHKKRRMGEAERVDEDAFWLGDPAAGLNKNQRAGPNSGPAATTGPSHAAPLLYRRRQAQVDVAPVSPPPSHRRPAVATPKAFVIPKPEPHIATDSPPVPQRTRSSTRRALRDSPDNPFLATPEKHLGGTPSPSDSSANPSPHSPLHERPTIAYVLYVSCPPSCISILTCLFTVVVFDANARIHCTIMLRIGRFLLLLNLNFLSIIRSILLLFIALLPAFLPMLVQRGRNLLPPNRTQFPRRLGSVRCADGGDVGEFRPLMLDFGPEKRANTQTLDQELRGAGKSVFLWPSLFYNLSPSILTILIITFTLVLLAMSPTSSYFIYQCVAIPSFFSCDTNLQATRSLAFSLISRPYLWFRYLGK